MAERVSVERAVEVLWHRGPPVHTRWSVGSGFLIGGDRVLTAAHNVGAGTLLVRIDGQFEHAAEITTDASGAGLDLAVVQITDQAFSGPPPVGFALIDRGSPDTVDGCWAVGFPRFKERARGPDDRPLRDAAHVHGSIAPGANRISGLFGVVGDRYAAVAASDTCERV